MKLIIQNINSDIISAENCYKKGCNLRSLDLGSFGYNYNKTYVCRL